MIYLDNAATGGFKPDAVKQAVHAALEVCANPGRSGHRLSLAVLEQTYNARKVLCEYFNGYSFDRVVFTKNCTEALNIALLGTLRRGDNVVTTVAEHNSVLRPLHALEGLGVKVDYAPLGDDGEISVKNILSFVTPQTKAVVITLASNVTGASPDIPLLKANLPPQTWLICDGAQACGHVPLDMQKLGIDALAVAGHKGMLGMQGSGVLLFSSRLCPSPLLFGGTGSESFNLAMPDFYPDRLEGGTLSYPAVASLSAGALYLRNHGDGMREKVLALTQRLIDGLCPFAKVYSVVNPFGIVAFSLPQISSEEVASILSDDYDICVRGGLHCAPLMHKALGSTGLVRASISAFNSYEEVQALISAVGKIAQIV